MVSFFDPPPPPPEPPRPPEPRRVREWAGPPEQVIPGVVVLDLCLLHEERLAVWIRDAEVYPAGLLLTVVLFGRQPPRPGIESGPGTWRFGLQFSDGRKATTYGLSSAGQSASSALASSSSETAGLAGDPDWSPEAPLLRRRGVSGGGTRWRVDYWLWPLPPTGDLLFACEWPDLGLDLSTASIDADVLRKAADRSQSVWPAQPPTQ